MPAKNKQPSQPKLEKKVNAKWSLSETRLMLEHLAELQRQAPIPIKPWTSRHWDEVAALFSDPLKTSYACCNKYAYLHNDYYAPMLKLSKKSGWGMNEDLGCIEATDELWQEVIEETPSNKRFYNNPWPLFAIFGKTCTDTTATGRPVFIPGDGLVNEEESGNDGDEEDGGGHHDSVLLAGDTAGVSEASIPSSGQNRFRTGFASQEPGPSRLTTTLPSTGSKKRKATSSPAADTQITQQKSAATARAGRRDRAKETHEVELAQSDLDRANLIKVLDTLVTKGLPANNVVSAVFEEKKACRQYLVGAEFLSEEEKVEVLEMCMESQTHRQTVLLAKENPEDEMCRQLVSRLLTKNK
ncbi:hypothetical protein CNB02525 [Cryptococcus deneoformans JEC21]|nr:hypothetical protein CNB02525 [Cryptococcus neoformans var. neoformans JEC21]ALO60390.1 hypothetical protein CNB02525 [Cryptococcus neoformans var. neoformans JEC21]